MSGIIAIVGRPNVGKSALFNRIAGRRIAIVHDRPGVTRDRITAELEWAGRPFTLIDTGGIGVMRGEKERDEIMKSAYDQVQIAIESAHVILFVVNVQEGILPLDSEVALRLRKSGRPVLLVVNKVDQGGADPATLEFSQLGFDRLFHTSAIHRRGIDEVMETAMGYLPVEATAAGPSEADGDKPVKLAFVGRPNVGKSSIINALTRSDRVIVSDVPGTTRDSVDVPFEVETEGVRSKYVLIDTAGMRKSRRVDDAVEFFSVKRTEDAIGRSDIAVLVLDAVSGILEQDKKVADVIMDKKRACILVVNKWDLVSKEVRKFREEEIQRRVENTRKRDDVDKKMSTLSEFGEWVQKKLFFLDYAPVIFTSAREGFHLDRLLEAIRYVAAQLQQKIPTAVLNRTLNDAVEKRQPISNQGHRLKFFYATQIAQSPPVFVLFVNREELISDEYLKYLSREMRRAFGFEGCPLILKSRPRPKKVESIRKHGVKKASPRASRGGKTARKSAVDSAPKPGGKSAREPGAPASAHARVKPTRKTTGKPARRGLKHRSTGGHSKRAAGGRKR